MVSNFVSTNEIVTFSRIYLIAYFNNAAFGIRDSERPQMRVDSSRENGREGRGKAPELVVQCLSISNRPMIYDRLGRRLRTEKKRRKMRSGTRIESIVVESALFFGITISTTNLAFPISIGLIL